MHLLNVIPPMLLVAQLFLVIILNKADICPGQRKRINKQLGLVAICWLIATLLSGYLVIVVGLLLITRLLNPLGKKSNKLKPKLAEWAMWLSTLVAFLFTWVLLLTVPWGQWLFIIANGVVLGALFALVLLLQARSRLQAFNRILPSVAIIGTMLMPFSIMLSAQEYNMSYVQGILTSIILCLLTMMGSVVLSAWHLFSHKLINKWNVRASFIFYLTSSLYLSPLLY